jgi:predicted Fe-S protein YdhL (DUF1289 family)
VAAESPCIDICRFDGRTGYCLGCFRTLEEARTWRKRTGHRRHFILRDRSKRELKISRHSKVES